MSDNIKKRIKYKILSYEEIKDVKRDLTTKFGKNNIQFKKGYIDLFGKMEVTKILVKKQNSNTLWETYGVLIESEKLNVQGKPKLSRLRLESEENKDNIKEELDNIFDLWRDK